MPSKKIIKEDLFRMVKEIGFKDPVSKRLPNNEEQLSALLALFHQQGKINWNNIIFI